jgi:RHS repeat-associated protein
MSAGTKSDKANRLTPVESYQYDAGGRRIATLRGTNVVRHVYNLSAATGAAQAGGMHVIADTDAAGNLLRSYTWGPGIDNLLAMTVYGPGRTNTYQAISDHLGTVHALVTPGGTVAERYEYDAWGNVLGVYDSNGNPLTSDLGLPTSALNNRYLFQGREYSWATHAAWGGAGLYFFRARYYDPLTGRWLSNDPIGIGGGLNQYAFCANNPVMFVDPEGETIEATTTVIGLAELRVATGPGVMIGLYAVYDTDGDWGLKVTVGAGAGVEAAVSPAKGIINWIANLLKGKSYGKSPGHIDSLRGAGQEGHVGFFGGISFNPEASGSCVITGVEGGGIGGGVYWTWSFVLKISDLFAGEGSPDPRRLEYMPAFGWRPY